MPNWITTPPENQSSSGIRLIRTPTAHPLLAIVLSDTLTGCNTHFVNQRTIPCESPNCEPCGEGIGWRWHGYLAIIIDATRELALFETTAAAAAAFIDYHQRYQTLRGCHFKAQRLNARQNGRVLIQAKPADLAKVTLPAAPDVHRLLCHIWNIAPNQVDEADHMTRPPATHLQVDKTKPEITTPRQARGPTRIPADPETLLKDDGNGEFPDAHHNNLPQPRPK